MVVCVHEADGKSYEHTLFIKAEAEKHMVKFNTKYKRIRRTTKKFKQQAPNSAPTQEEGISVWGLAMNEEEKQEWGVVDWDEADDETASRLGLFNFRKLYMLSISVV